MESIASFYVIFTILQFVTDTVWDLVHVKWWTKTARKLALKYRYLPSRFVYVVLFIANIIENCIRAAIWPRTVFRVIRTGKFVNTEVFED